MLPRSTFGLFFDLFDLFLDIEEIFLIEIFLDLSPIEEIFLDLFLDITFALVQLVVSVRVHRIQ
jgi:hypothetical protein